MRLSHGVSVFAVLAVLAGCGEKEPILEGERISVRAGLGGPTLAETREAQAPREVPLSLPAAQVNANWTHRGGNAAHRLVHPALSAPQDAVFSANIGQGNSRRFRITADPVVEGGSVFTLDSRALVTATGTNGATLWQADLTPPSDRSDDASGGGIAVDDGKVFVTTGFGELVALDAASGAVLWRQNFDAGVGGAPAVAGGIVYAVARDSSAWAIRATDGRVLWQLPGMPAPAGVSGVSAPAVTDGLVIFPFPSGELIAANREDGTRAWLAQVAGSRGGRAYATFTDLTGDPVVDGKTVYAGSSAGRVAAFDIDTGRRIWSATEGAVSPVWPVGGAIFLVSDEARLIRLDAATGKVVWAVELPYFVKQKIKRQKAIVASFGPILAGGRLYIASTDEKLRSFDPVSGALITEYDLPGGAASAPVVAGGTLYIVSGKGQLLAFR
ncbi:PQQ-like beta-propeller repeat protein [Ostreiculturibacter nitratireducens]|uniref:PQQ-like beta-propeller repeat protein n=1 Tax=Ostreiculturibacter nitratireducens TaxID=3075226 RepID=UPI0031B5A3FC